MVRKRTSKKRRSKKRSSKRKYQNRCNYCGKLIYHIPHFCSVCRRMYCSEHRVPESHGCKKRREGSIKYYEEKKFQSKAEIKAVKKPIEQISEKPEPIDTKKEIGLINNDEIKDGYIDDYGYMRGQVRDLPHLVDWPHSSLIHRQKAYYYIYLNNRKLYPYPFKKYEVHHRNHDKLDNRISNLELYLPEKHKDVHWEEAQERAEKAARKCEKITKFCEEEKPQIKSESIRDKDYEAYLKYIKEQEMDKPKTTKEQHEETIINQVEEEVEVFYQKHRKYINIIFIAIILFLCVLIWLSISILS